MKNKNNKADICLSNMAVTDEETDFTMATSDNLLLDSFPVVYCKSRFLQVTFSTATKNASVASLMGMVSLS